MSVVFHRSLVEVGVFFYIFVQVYQDVNICFWWEFLAFFCIFTVVSCITILGKSHKFIAVIQKLA